MALEFTCSCGNESLGFTRRHGALLGDGLLVTAALADSVVAGRLAHRPHLLRRHVWRDDGMSVNPFVIDLFFKHSLCYRRDVLAERTIAACGVGGSLF